MATLVREIMNPELLSVLPTEPLERIRNTVVSLGITAVPVLESTGELKGLVSLRDCDPRRKGSTAADVMSEPVSCIAADAEISIAAHMMSDRNVHHLVVVDKYERAVGFLSSLDVVRGLIGVPAKRPAAFPHLDHATGQVWTDDLELDADHVTSIPKGGGVVMLIYGGTETRETPVWAEATDDMRQWLLEVVALPQVEDPILAHWLATGRLRVRATVVEDEERREQVLEKSMAKVKEARRWL